MYFLNDTYMMQILCLYFSHDFIQNFSILTNVLQKEHFTSIVDYVKSGS
jgi:hypothetical protein